LVREFFFLPFSLFALLKLRRERFDLLHVNEVTLLPLGIIAKKFLRLPMVVHVRSLQRRPGSSWRTRLINHWLRTHADSVVAIDHSVAATLESNLPLVVIHNGLRVKADAVGVQLERSASAPVRAGFLGVLIALKGIYELVEAMRILKDRGVVIECFVAGENARKLSEFRAWALGLFGFARDVRADLELLIRKHGLQNHVRLLGFVEDVHALYPTLDILCFPSHLNAAGRPVFEAAFYGIPSIVAVSDPLPDAVQHEITGLAVATPDPVLIADALQRLAENAEYRRKLGIQARNWAMENFSIENSAASMFAAYKRLIGAHTSQ
jgi:glycosyltransferase involved in cell wall biosynthesis